MRALRTTPTLVLALALVVTACGGEAIEGVKVSATEPVSFVLQKEGPGWSLGPEKSK